jgi:hypothetical protein
MRHGTKRGDCPICRLTKDIPGWWWGHLFSPWCAVSWFMDGFGGVGSVPCVCVCVCVCVLWSGEGGTCRGPSLREQDTAHLVQGWVAESGFSFLFSSSLTWIWLPGCISLDKIEKFRPGGSPGCPPVCLRGPTLQV